MDKAEHIISSKKLTIDRVREIIAGGEKIAIGKDAQEAVAKCRRYLDTKMEDIGRPVWRDDRVRLAVQHNRSCGGSVAAPAQSRNVPCMRNRGESPSGDCQDNDSA